MEFFRGAFSGGGNRTPHNFSQNFNRSIPKYNYNVSKNFYAAGNIGANSYYPYYYGYPNIYYLESNNDDSDDNNNKEDFNNIISNNTYITGGIIVFFGILISLLYCKNLLK